MKDKMVACKVCGNEIAKNAKKCPHCGAQRKRELHKHIAAIIPLVIVLLIAGLVIKAKITNLGTEVRITLTDGTPYSTTIKEFYEEVRDNNARFHDAYINVPAIVEGEITEVKDMHYLENLGHLFDGLLEINDHIYVEVDNPGDYRKGDKVRVLGSFTKELYGEPYMYAPVTVEVID